MRRPVAVLTLVATALLAAPSAHATTPLITDPAGDADLVTGACTAAEQPSCPASRPALSEDAIDLLEGDLVQSGANLVFTINVVDLEAAPLVHMSRSYRFGFDYAGMSVDVVLGRVGTDTPDAPITSEVHVYDPLKPLGAQRTVAYSLDTTTDTIEWTVPLSVLNDALEQMCATCADVGSGSTFDDLKLSAEYQANVGNMVMSPLTTREDTATTTSSFTLS